MFCLSIEASSSGQGSWAVLDGTRLIFHEVFVGKTSSALFTSLEKGREKWKNVEQIFVGVGPGSFSGVRVALAAAQGIALVSHAKVTAARSSNTVALKFEQEERLGVFTHGRKGEYLVTFYQKGKYIPPTKAFLAETLQQELSQTTFAVCTEPIAQISTLIVPDAYDLARYCLFYGIELGLPLDPIHVVVKKDQSR